MVDAEYGNQGVDFKMIPREGFGWMNGMSLSDSVGTTESLILWCLSRLPSRIDIYYRVDETCSQLLRFAREVFRQRSWQRGGSSTRTGGKLRPSRPCFGGYHGVNASNDLFPTFTWDSDDCLTFASLTCCRLYAVRMCSRNRQIV